MTTPKPAPPLGQAADKFLATLKEAETRKSRAAALLPLTTQFGADTPLGDIDPADIADWMQDKWGALSAGTWNNRAAAIRAAYKWWFERRWITRDDLDDAQDVIRRVRDKPERPAEILTPEEVQALLAQPSLRYPTGIRNRAIIMLLYRSGLRVGELTALRPADLDHKHRSIRVLDPKTGKPQTRFWHESADDALLRWEDKRHELGINGHHRLFCTLKGEPLGESYIRSTMLPTVARKAGIVKRVHAHGLRHTFAVELEAAGATTTEISKLLGHGRTSTTSIYLSHLSNAEAGRALGRVDLPDVSTGTGSASEYRDARLARIEEAIAEFPGMVESFDVLIERNRRLAEEIAELQRRQAEQEAGQ